MKAGWHAGTLAGTLAMAVSVAAGIKSNTGGYETNESLLLVGMILGSELNSCWYILCQQGA